MKSGHPDVLLLALALDWLMGEPPNTLHPVVWLGQLITLLEQHAPHDAPRAELLYGAGMTVTCIGVAVAPAWLLPRSRLAEAMLLKTMFAWRTLHQAGARVRGALAADDGPAARAALRWLVSRDTAQLDSSLLAAAAIESLAENASDSVVAPVFAYVLGGLPAVCVYRAVNTLDAMIGYRGRYEYLGKVAARLDDLLNLLPARLTGLLIVVAAWLVGADARQAWHVLRHDHAATASPNAGYPMAAMAGALGVRLEKVGHYCLHRHAPAPTADDLCRAEQLVFVAVGLACSVALIATRQSTLERNTR